MSDPTGPRALRDRPALRRFADALAAHDAPLRPAPVVVARAVLDTALGRTTPTPAAGAGRPESGSAPTPVPVPPLRRLVGSASSARTFALVVVGAASTLTALTLVPVRAEATAPSVDVPPKGPSTHISPSAAPPSSAPPDPSAGVPSLPDDVTLGDAVVAARLSVHPALDVDLARRLRSVRRRLPIPPGLPLGTPVSVGVVSSPYGPRRHPVSGRSHLHAGTDFAVPTGTPVFATADGRVRAAARRSGYGLVVEVGHSDPSGLSTTTIYAHLSGALVRPGFRVRRGQVLGLSGGGSPHDGVSTGPHLHYEVRVGSSPADPASLHERVLVWRAGTARELRAVAAEAHARDARRRHAVPAPPPDPSPHR
ncbi:peptidoglycan DD-metalloendopeptidase family protein [Rubrivirga sp. S365]|uniref:M23 family metallopeptidase n=1 Tax=Rubrivirga sp. S365 TaxID=3076080 RepID=UPI00391F663F